MTKSIVVVHGVGSPELGSEIKRIADAVADENSAMQISCIRSQNTDVAVGELSHGDNIVRLYELNWSHITRPANGAWHTLGQLFCLVFAAAQIAQGGWAGQNSNVQNTVDAPSLIGAFYRWILVTITIWAPILSGTLIMAEILSEDFKIAASLIVLGVGVAVYVAAQLLRNIEPMATKFGRIWACVIAVLGLLVAVNVIDRATLSPITRSTVLIGIYGTGVLMLLGIAESFWRGKLARCTIRSSSFRAAMFVIPFIVLAAAWPPVIFTAQFMVIDSFVGADRLNWADVESVYDTVAKNLPYDIVTLEIINFIAFFLAVSALVVSFLIWNSFLGSHFAEAQDWGGQFRRIVAIWLLLLILAGMISFVPVFVETFDHLMSGGGPKEQPPIPTGGVIGHFVSFFIPSTHEDWSPLEIYRASMWRICAVLLFLIPMVTRPLVIFSQIIFYICPTWSPISTQRELVEQFENVTRLAFQQSGEAPIVLAYSQGSKIAADAIALSNTPIKSLVTIGSPVDAIHVSFLAMPVPKHGVTWLNFYRRSDFIGGMIGGEHVRNSLIEDNFISTHFNYYRERAVLKAIGLG